MWKVEGALPSNKYQKTLLTSWVGETSIRYGLLRKVPVVRRGREAKGGRKLSPGMTGNRREAAEVIRKNNVVSVRTAREANHVDGNLIENFFNLTRSKGEGSRNIYEGGPPSEHVKKGLFEIGHEENQAQIAAGRGNAFLAEQGKGPEA